MTVFCTSFDFSLAWFTYMELGWNMLVCLRKILSAKHFQIIIIISLFCDSSERFWLPGGSFVCWTGFGMLVFQLLFFPILANFLGPILTTRIGAVGCWTFAWTTPLLLTLTGSYYADFGVVLIQWLTHLYQTLLFEIIKDIVTYMLYTTGCNINTNTT